MKLIIKDIEQKLIANWNEGDKDHRPVVKFFYPAGSAIWLITELCPQDKKTMFGLCDLGFGFPEMGYVQLTELEGIRIFGSLRIKRDIHFRAEYPLSVYAAAARVHGFITFEHQKLEQAKAALEAEKRQRHRHLNKQYH